MLGSLFEKFELCAKVITTNNISGFELAKPWGTQNFYSLYCDLDSVNCNLKILLVAYHTSYTPSGDVHLLYLMLALTFESPR